MGKKIRKEGDIKLFCVRCGSENIDESEAVEDHWICGDCGYEWKVGTDGEAEPDIEQDTTEQDSNEDSEGDGLVLGDDPLFPPEDFGSE